MDGFLLLILFHFLELLKRLNFLSFQSYCFSLCTLCLFSWRFPRLLIFFLLRFYFFSPFSLNFLSLMFLFITTLFTYLVLIYFKNEVFYFVRILMVIFWSFLNPASFFFPEVAFFSLFEFPAFTLKAFLKCLVILYFPLIAKHGSL